MFMADKKLKIGVVGLIRGEFVLKCAKYLSDRMEIAAVCEINDGTIQKAKDNGSLQEGVPIFKDYDEFLKCEMDGVVLANYFTDHCEFAIKAMYAGIPVLSETTAAPTLGDCVRLVEAYEETKTKYMLGTNGAFSRPVQAIKNIIQSGKYGPVVYADAEYIHPPMPGSKSNVDSDNLHWRNTLPCCYYNMHDLGPIMYITNSVPVRAVGKAVVTPYESGFKNTNKHYALLDMSNGAVVNYSGCTGVGSLGNWYRVACKDGTCETVRYKAFTDKMIEAGDNHGPDYGLEENVFEREFSWSECGAVTKEEEVLVEKSINDGLHYGLDMVLMIHFLRFLNDEEEPFFNVYRSVALSAAGILSWYSMLSDSKPMDIPDFTKKEERDKVRDDFRMPFGKTIDELTLPFNIGEKFER